MGWYARGVDAALLSALAAAAVGLYCSNQLPLRIGAAVLGLLTAAVAWVSSGPAQWLRDLHNTSSICEGTAVRNLRKVGGGPMPTPFPSAFYAVCFSQELPPGKLLSVTVCGHNLVVWRPHAKKGETAWPAPVISDAACPHLGAHLGLGGGRVEEDAHGNSCLRCPFHGWKFDSEGKLREVPGAASAPSGGDLRVWPCQERNSVVSVWMSGHVHKAAPLTPEETARIEARIANFQYADKEVAAKAAAAAEDAPRASGSSKKKEPVALAYDDAKATGAAAGGAAATAGCEGSCGDAAAAAAAKPAMPCSAAEVMAARRKLNQPWYEVPSFPALDGGATWDYHGFTENIVNALIFEIPENGSDVAHLPALHSGFVVPSLGWLFSHKWGATWDGSASNPQRSHIADITVSEAIMMRQKWVLPGEVDVKITQCGISQVFLEMRTPVGPLVIVETVTPVSPLQLRVLHAVYTPSYMPAVIAKVILYVTLWQFEKDVPIWSNKIYKAKPILASADPGIPMYRRWTSQFNTPDSISFEEAMKQHARDALGFTTDATLAW